jgi:putative transposase
LSWRLSNTMEADFCVAALEEALARYGKPEIFNSDQGSQGGFKRSSQQPLHALLYR